MSKVIAVAGGSGGIGQHIVDGLLSSKKFKVVVLSRKEQPEFTKKGIEVKVVDYDSVDSLKTALTGVDTVISCVLPLPGYVASHTRLIQACEAVAVKRFIPSEWAHDIEKYPHLFKELYAEKTALREVLAKSSLEHTIVCNGLFMDYFLPRSQQTFRPTAIPINMENFTAVIPGDGNAPTTCTLGDEIGEVIAFLMEVPKWDKFTFISGDTFTWNHAVQLAEKYTGKKFKVTYESKEDIQKRIDEAKDPMSRFYAQVDLAYANGDLVIAKKGNFPGVNFTTLEGLLQRTYGKKD